MNHEIVGPENRMIGRQEASDLSMPGQLRIPKDIAIAKHIAQFWNPPEWYKSVDEGYRQIDAEKKRNDKYVAVIGMSYEKSLELPYAQQDLLRQLHEAGNNEAASEIASNLTLTESVPIIHLLMLKARALTMYLSGRDDGWDYKRAGIKESEVIPIVQEIARTNAHWPTPTKKWEQNLQQELRGLQYIERRDWETGFGLVGPSTKYWTINRKSKD